MVFEVQLMIGLDRIYLFDNNSFLDQVLPQN